jgi:hypothetical protein
LTSRLPNFPKIPVDLVEFFWRITLECLAAAIGRHRVATRNVHAATCRPVYVESRRQSLLPAWDGGLKHAFRELAARVFYDA